MSNEVKHVTVNLIFFSVLKGELLEKTGEQAK